MITVKKFLALKPGDKVLVKAFLESDLDGADGRHRPDLVWIPQRYSGQVATVSGDIDISDYSILCHLDGEHSNHLLYVSRKLIDRVI